MTARMLDSQSVIGVVGAGAMGSGIAQLALARGHRVLLTDAAAPVLDRAHGGIERALARDVEKGRLSADEAAAATKRLTVVPPQNGLEAFGECGVVIEAIVERLDVKQTTFRALEQVVGHDAILATNTSSLSIASIGAACERAERVVGIHFFNPAPIMPLVEIIPAVRTEGKVMDAVEQLVSTWGKTTVRAADTPGFIVNRIARPYYGEALRLFEEGVADIATIDWAMRSIGGFRMGPFELMDFIGHDVNYVVTESVWQAMYFDPRYRPSLTQKRLLEAGLLGKKSGRGFYNYGTGGELPKPHEDRALGEMIFRRILAMLVNEAVDAVFYRVATPRDIEVAMTKGVNYPKGLLRWGEEIGLATVLETIRGLQDDYGEDRYRPSPLLVRMVRDGSSFASAL